MSLLSPPGITKSQADASYQSAKALVVDVTAQNTITTANALASRLTFAGALTANMNFIFPVAPRPRQIENATTGAFTLSIQRGVAGTPVPIPQGETYSTL